MVTVIAAPPLLFVPTAWQYAAEAQAMLVSWSGVAWNVHCVPPPVAPSTEVPYPTPSQTNAVGQATAVSPEDSPESQLDGRSTSCHRRWCERPQGAQSLPLSIYPAATHTEPRRTGHSANSVHGADVLSADAPRQCRCRCGNRFHKCRRHHHDRTEHHHAETRGSSSPHCPRASSHVARRPSSAGSPGDS